jgi:hypothetical protein
MNYFRGNARERFVDRARTNARPVVFGAIAIK